MMRRPKLTGINQITLRVNDMRVAEEFYVELLGFHVDRRAGANIVYLRINSDLLVLVKAETPGMAESRDIRVDHFGFRLSTDAEVDDAAAFLEDQGVHMVTRPANRREGRAFFVMDPDGNLVEFYSMKSRGSEAPQEIDTTSAARQAAEVRKSLSSESEQQKPRRSRK